MFISKKNLNVRYDFDFKNLKPPFLILFSHPSIMDYIYLFHAIRPFIANSIISRWYFHNFFLRFVLPKLGGIPKRLFTIDSSAVKNIITIINKGGIITLSPEGLNSPNGASQQFIASTSKLVKKLNVPVVSVVINGAFLTHPSYNYNAKHSGRIDVIVDLMFTPDEISQKTNEELLAGIEKKLGYNDFKWAGENNIEFKADNRAKGLSNLLYICIKCKSQFKMETADNKLQCSICGFGGFVDTSFQLIDLGENEKLPIDIAQWFDIQDDVIKAEVALPDFEIREKCTARAFTKHGIKLVDRYKGELLINKAGVRFIGKDVKTGNEKIIFKKIEDMPRVSNTVNKGIYFYFEDTCYEFALENGIKATQCAQAVHHLHNLVRNNNET
jgi:1-acyl-sn-glycerol-3-phosphate acyltransferase